ncbi:unnamed protein product [Psylliodes chrysocephalus]|uniref:Uncharacterized protein n=1 Tax=Psylliodes chrysocephalus TaxID=3402493 RepID=A0A9P0D284_9CUCU|nr:unnamed protein product [Psylliodes chrysocephala]
MMKHEDSDNDDILLVKRRDLDSKLPTAKEIADMDLGRNKNKKPISKAAAAKKILKKKIDPNQKTVFDDQGEAVLTTIDQKFELAMEYENEDEGGIDIERVKKVLRIEDKFDKQLF